MFFHNQDNFEVNTILPHRTLTTVASYARLVSEPKAPALDAAAKVRQNNETTKPSTKKNSRESRELADKKELFTHW